MFYKNILNLVVIYFASTFIQTGIVFIYHLLYLFIYCVSVSSIKCYQCSSDEDGKGVDNCGAYQYFDTNKNIAVDCMGEEAVTPGMIIQLIISFRIFEYTFEQAHFVTSQFSKAHEGLSGMADGELLSDDVLKLVNEVMN